MKTFVVTLKMQIGEYEKYNMIMVEADTREQAGKMALALECHGDAHFDEENPDDMVWDMGGEMAYKVYRVEEADITEVSVLKKFMGSAFTYNEDQIAELVDG